MQEEGVRRRSARLARKRNAEAPETVETSLLSVETRCPGQEAIQRRRSTTAHGASKQESQSRERQETRKGSLRPSVSGQSRATLDLVLERATRVGISDHDVGEKRQDDSDFSKRIGQGPVQKRGRRESAGLELAPKSPAPEAAAVTVQLSDPSFCKKLDHSDAKLDETGASIHDGNEGDTVTSSPLVSVLPCSHGSASSPGMQTPLLSSEQTTDILNNKQNILELSAAPGRPQRPERQALRSKRRRHSGHEDVKTCSSRKGRSQPTRDLSSSGQHEPAAGTMKTTANAVVQLRSQQSESLATHSFRDAEEYSGSKSACSPGGLHQERATSTSLMSDQARKELSCSGSRVSRSTLTVTDEGVSVGTRADVATPIRVCSTQQRQAEPTTQPVLSNSTAGKIDVDSCDECIEAATARQENVSLVDGQNKPAADLREIVLKQRIRHALETIRAHRELGMEKPRTELKQHPSTIRPSGTNGVQRDSAPGHENRDERVDKRTHSNELQRTMNGSRERSPEIERSSQSEDKVRGTGARRAVQSIDRDRLERISSQAEAHHRTERISRGVYSTGPRMNAVRQHSNGYQGAPAAAPDHRSSVAKTFDGVHPAKRAQRRAPVPESSSSRPVRERRSRSTEDGEHPSIPLAMERIAKQAAFVVQAAAAASTMKPSDEVLAGADSSARSEAEHLCWLWLHGPDVGSQPARRVVLRNLPPSATEDALYMFLVHVMAAACCFSYDYVRWHQHYSGWSERHHRGAAMAAAAGRFGAAKRRQLQPAERHRIGVTRDDEIASLFDDNKILSLLKLTPIWDLQLVAKHRMAFVECLTVSEATGLVQLNGLLFQGHQLLIRRPREFDADSWSNSSGLSKRDQEALRHPPPRFCPAHIEANIVSPDVSMNEVLPAPASVFYGYIGQIPFHLTEYTIINWLRDALVEWPWRLTAFRLAREGNSGLSRGFAFFRLDATKTELKPADAIDEMDASTVARIKVESSHFLSNVEETTPNRMLAGTKNTLDREQLLEHLRSVSLPGSTRSLIIREANAHRGGDRSSAALQASFERRKVAQDSALAHGAYDTGQVAFATTDTESPSATAMSEMCVLVLVQLVAPSLLADEQERKEILEEVEEEMTKFGPIEQIRLDERPVSPAAGTVYVHFTSPADAATAANAMQGRRFDGRPVIAKLMNLSEMSARLGAPPTENRLVVLPGIVDERAFTDAAERADIALDIREEMLQFAESVDVEIPIPPDPDAGAALIRFPAATAARRAVAALQGRLFDGRPVQPYLR